MKISELRKLLNQVHSKHDDVELGIKINGKNGEIHLKDIKGISYCKFEGFNLSDGEDE